MVKIVVKKLHVLIFDRLTTFRKLDDLLERKIMYGRKNELRPFAVFELSFRPPGAVAIIFRPKWSFYFYDRYRKECFKSGQCQVLKNF